MDNEQVAKERLSRARARLVLDHAFFAGMVLPMPLVPAPAKVETAGTDGTSLFYAPEYVANLTQAATLGLLAHEVFHVVDGHHWRRGGRDPETWNLAGDATINPRLVKLGFTLPEGGFFDAECEGKSVEEAYRILKSRQPPPSPKGEEGQGKPGKGEPEPMRDPGRCGAVMDSPLPKAEAEEQAKIRIVQAARAAMAAGNCPAEIAELVAEIIHPVADWRALLRRFLDSSARNDYSWSRPSRRMIAQGLYLPSLHSLEMGEIVLCVDVSGSMHPAASQVAGEVMSAAETLRPARLHVVYANTAVVRAESYAPGEPVEIKPCASGGTDFRPAFDWISENVARPACVVYLTDLDGPAPSEAPPYPVIWASTRKDAAGPWGETIWIGGGS